MATVAIIGVLSAIALPNYLKYQRKARQAESRVALSSIFTLETAAQMSPETGNSFHACLKTLGADAQGDSYYAVGFKSTTTFAATCGPTGTGTCLAFSWAKVAGVDTAKATCTANTVDNTFFNAIKGEQASGTFTVASGADLPAASVAPVSKAAFNVGAGGWIGGSNPDQWEINQNKEIYQLQDGVN